MKPLPSLALTLLLVFVGACSAPKTGGVIFIHPDGASAATWEAGRALHVGPDAELHWDKLPHIALYRGHMADSLTATSNGGATTHATGLKVASDAFGKSAGGSRGQPLLDSQGRPVSVALQALRGGLPVGLVQSGSVIEPGTACFVTAVDSRKDYDLITRQLVESGATVILGGGEQHYLPRGVKGHWGEGMRKDDLNLLDRAKALGYTVVRTREELLRLPDSTPRVLGVFAWDHTFNDKTEEELAAQNKPLYDPAAPTIAEMTAVALRVLRHQNRRFLLVVEEEGTDNFGNKNNAAGVFEALRRADEALGVGREFVVRHPDTLLITAADSDAGGLRVSGIPLLPGVSVPAKLPATDENGAPMDGVGGTGSAPFLAAPDRTGQRLPFVITWAARDDVSGGVLVRAQGLNAHLVRGSFDNTRVAELARQTLFGR